MPIDRREALARGAADVLVKPFSPREILARAKRLLARSHELREQRRRAQQLERELHRAQDESRRAQGELRREQRLRELAYGFGRDLHRSLDPDDVAARLLAAARRLLGCESVALYAAGPVAFDGGAYRLLAHAGADSARRYLNGDLSAVASDSVVKLAGKIRDESLRVLAEQTRLQSAHGASAQRVILVGMVLTFLLAGIALQPMRTEVAARITSQIVREHHEAIPELAHDAADAASAAHARLQAMHRLVASLATVRDAAAGARTIVTSARDMLGVTLAAVIVPNGAGGFSVLAASHEGFDSVSPELASAVAATLRTGEPAMAESRAERTRQWGTLAALDTAGARGSVLFAPLTREAVANGVLIAALDDDRVFDDDVLSCAATLGRLGGPAVAARPLTS